jgi:ABC-2 type transport system permease protein
MTGLGILLLGLPPSGEEVLRGIGFLIASLAYSGVWLAAALLFSTVFRSPATSALAALTLWLLFAVFWSMLTPLIANAVAPVDPFDASTAVANAYWSDGISRISPNTLYGQMMQGLLDPATRTFGIVFLTQLEGALMQAPLSFEQSALLIWPQLAGLVAGTVLLYTLAYVLFQRQEIRA